MCWCMRFLMFFFIVRSCVCLCGCMRVCVCMRFACLYVRLSCVLMWFVRFRVLLYVLFLDCQLFVLHVVLVRCVPGGRFIRSQGSVVSFCFCVCLCLRFCLCLHRFFAFVRISACVCLYVCVPPNAIAPSGCACTATVWFSPRLLYPFVVGLCSYACKIGTDFLACFCFIYQLRSNG